MHYNLTMTSSIASQIQAHLFQNELEQAAFLFARPLLDNQQVILKVEKLHLIEADIWPIQQALCKEIRQLGHSSVIQEALKNNFTIISCHSHPGSRDKVIFSQIDKVAIEELVSSAKETMPEQGFAATVWGEYSVDAVYWERFDTPPRPISTIKVTSNMSLTMETRSTWFE
jgi:hypothetical protein